VLSQLVPVSNATLDLQNLMLQADILKNLTAAASYELAFRADAPPLGYSTYTISPAEAVDLTTRNPIAGALSSTVRSWLNGTKQENNATEPQSTLQVANKLISVTLSPQTGKLLSLRRLSDNSVTQLDSEV
jgi:hypothetical protein